MSTKIIEGAAASPGIGSGPALVIQSNEPSIPDLSDPLAAFVAAAATAAEQLRSLAGRIGDDLADAAEILSAQAMMAEDPMFADEIESRLGGGNSLAEALAGAAEHVAEGLRSSGSEYLAERANDVAEVARRITFALAGVPMAGLSDLTEPRVVVARSLTAADTAGMQPDLVRGFVTEEGGPTGHVAVIARALRIPAVVAAEGVVAATAAGDQVIVDGGRGRAVLRPDEDTAASYETRAAAHRARLEAAQRYRGKRIAIGGRSMAIAANVGGPDDIEQAVAEGADGIGLYRTEFLFLDTDEPPSEDEQVAVYQQALGSFDDPVVIRTLDIGGDKPAPYLQIDEEENPFLGVRGMRLYPHEQELAATQARALLRAADTGTLWVMAPMVTTVDDAIYLRQMFADAQADLAGRGIEHGAIKLGVMVEVPSVALNARAMAEVVDFFSIGTNDLTQYTLAVDRTSAPLARYMDAADPAVLRLCAMTAEASVDAGVSVSVCGEAAADPGLAVLFAAMGMDKLSVAAPAVNVIKQTLSEIDAGALPVLLERCLAAATVAEVRSLLDDVLPA